MISLAKSKILTTLNNCLKCGILAKIIVASGFEKLPKMQ